MTWEPSKDFKDFIQSLTEKAELSYDVKVAETVSGFDKDARYAGHCILWAKTNALGINKIPLKVLVNVGDQLSNNMIIGTDNVVLS